MQDGTLNTPAVPTDAPPAIPVQNQLSPEIQHGLAMAFGEQPIENPTATTDVPLVAPVVSTASEEAEVFDEPTYLKQNFGWESQEAAKAELGELRKLKQSTASPFDSLDENSKKIAIAIKENRIDDIYDYVSTQKMLAGLETKTPEEKLKSYLKVQNPLFNFEDIDWKYTKLYSVDESKYKDADGEVFDAPGLRIAELESKQRLQQDIEKATQYFASQKSTVKLPDFSAADTGYESYKKMMTESEAMNKETVEAYQKITPADIQLKAQFNDEANKLGIDFDFVPDKDSFTKAVALASDTDKFFADYYGEDGSPKRKQFLQDIYFAKNKDKIIGEAMKQAVNATMKWFIARNNGQGGQRQYNADHVVPDELKQHFEMAFAGQNGR